MRSKKAMLNIVISMAYQIVALVCGLITPRLILSTFGSTYNGVTSSATQFLSLVSVLRLGISGSTRVALYKTLAKNDKLGTSRIIKATEIYMRKVSIVIALYAVALSFLYPLISHNNLPWYDCTLIILIVSISTFAEYFFGITYSTLITADQREYVRSGIHIFTTILNTILVAVFIRLGANIFVVKLGSAVAYALLPVGMGLYCRKKYQLVRDCEPDDSAIQQRGAVAFHSIANIIHNNTDLVILTLFLDAKVISVYHIYYIVVGRIKTIMTVFTSGLEAAFGNMWAKGEYDTAKKNFRTYEFLMFSFVVVVFSCVGLLILPFVKQYTRGVHDTNYLLLDFAILVTVTEAMFCIRNPYVTMVQAAGKYKETKNGAAMEAVLNIVISLSLVSLIGLNGVIIGTLAANIFRTSQYSWYVSKNIFHRSIFEVVRRFLWLIVCAALIVAASLPVITWVSGLSLSGWAGWLVMAAIVFIIALAITVIMALIFYRNDLFSSTRLVRRMGTHLFRR